MLSRAQDANYATAVRIPPMVKQQLMGSALCACAAGPPSTAPGPDPPPVWPAAPAADVPMLRVLGCTTLAEAATLSFPWRPTLSLRPIARLEVVQAVRTHIGGHPSRGGEQYSLITATRLVTFAEDDEQSALALFADDDVIALCGQKRISELPRGVLLLPRLLTLDLSHCVCLRALPECMKPLHELKVLNLYCCTSLVDIDGIANLYRLEKLYCTNCLTLPRLPADMSRLRYLTTLELRFCMSLVALPESLSLLDNLRALSLEDCDALMRMPDLSALGSRLEVLHLPDALEPWDERGRKTFEVDEGE